MTADSPDDPATAPLSGVLPTASPSRAMMYPLRLVPSRSAAWASSPWRSGGMRRRRRPLGDGVFVRLSSWTSEADGWALTNRRVYGLDDGAHNPAHARCQAASSLSRIFASDADSTRDT